MTAVGNPAQNKSSRVLPRSAHRNQAETAQLPKTPTMMPTQAAPSQSNASPEVIDGIINPIEIGSDKYYDMIFIINPAASFYIPGRTATGSYSLIETLSETNKKG